EAMQWERRLIAVAHRLIISFLPALLLFRGQLRPGLVQRDAARRNDPVRDVAANVRKVPPDAVAPRRIAHTLCPQAIDAAGNDRSDHGRQGGERGEHRVARGFLGAGGGALGREDCLALQAVGLVQPLDAALLEPFVDPRRLAVEDAAIAHLRYLLEAQGLEPSEELLPGFRHYFLARLGANMPD